MRGCKAWLCISWAGGRQARDGDHGAGLMVWGREWGVAGPRVGGTGSSSAAQGPCEGPGLPHPRLPCGAQGLSPRCTAPSQPHSSAPWGCPLFLGGQKLPIEHGRRCWGSQPPPPPPPQVLRILAGKVVVGHAIHNDFKALRYSHPKALTRDTSQIPLLNRRGGFPENMTISLKRLTKALLDQDIQVPWLEPPRRWGPPVPCQGDSGEGRAIPGGRLRGSCTIQGTLNSATAASPGARQPCASVSPSLESSLWEGGMLSSTPAAFFLLFSP